MIPRILAGLVTMLVAAMTVIFAQAPQLRESVFDQLQHPAIDYDSLATGDAAVRLNTRLAAGEVEFTGATAPDILRSILKAFDIPVESQLLVFSKTSVQALRITRRNPRMLFFNDSTVVGWTRGGFVEVAVHTPRHGVAFYALAQDPGGAPSFMRRVDCIRCHHSYATLGVPGMINRSVAVDGNGVPIRQLADNVITDASPFEARWGGWFVTGTHGVLRHRGNGLVLDRGTEEPAIRDDTQNWTSVASVVDPGASLTPYSDIAALMVFAHQVQMTNLITRIGFETRWAAREQRTPDVPLADMAREVVDALLFVDEARLPSAIESTSGFVEKFTGRGPRDSKGRSLRDLDLKTRLMKYPCSYTIYSEAFDALPAETKSAIYTRMFDVLSGRDHSSRYGRLSPADRQAILDILSDTKRDWPRP